MAYLRVVLALSLASGCYLSHERAGDVRRIDAGTPAVVDDAGTMVRDAGTDGGTDAGAPVVVPDGSVTRPCAPGLGRSFPGGVAGESCDLTGDGDADGDGFANDVDCHPCSPQINPGAFDYPGNGVDEDCDGADDVACDDSGLSLEPGSAWDAARAMGLCQRAEGRSWGVLEARLTRADGTGEPADPIQVGVLPRFGFDVEPAAGASMLALSTGIARETGERGATHCLSVGEPSEFPPGFPVEAPACPDTETGRPFDAVALEVVVRVPTNVRALQFASHFYTHEYPRYICSEFNDVYAVLKGPVDGALENIAFDDAGNPITVNNALLSVCVAGRHGGRDFDCPGGVAPLFGTGYDVVCDGEISREESGASTGCIQTLSRVTPGEVLRLRFAIWDSGDAALDSLALVDAFDWVPQDFERVEP